MYTDNYVCARAYAHTYIHIYIYYIYTHIKEAKGMLMECLLAMLSSSNFLHICIYNII